MKIDNHGIRLVRQRGELGVGFGERGAGDPELDGAAQVEYADALTGSLDDCYPAPRISDRVVGRTNHSVGPVEELICLPMAVHVIAGGDHVDADLEQLVGGLCGDPDAAGGVLAVGDYEVGRVPLAQPGHRRGEPVSTGAADDVRDEEDAHGRESLFGPATGRARRSERDDPCGPPCGPHGSARSGVS